MQLGWCWSKRTLCSLQFRTLKGSEKPRALRVEAFMQHRSKLIMLFRGSGADDFCSTWKTHIHPFVNEDGVFMPTESKYCVLDSSNTETLLTDFHNNFITARAM